MKSVLISIQPKWCELIASGKKTIEVRKTAPNIATPFKVYIYCTEKDYDKIFCVDKFMHKVFLNGNGKQKVIGEFVCNNIDWHGLINLIVKEDAEHTLNGTCLTKEEVLNYLGYQKGTNIYACKNYDFYGWYISNLVIYDKPRELGEFKRFCDGVSGKIGCRGCKYYYEENDESQGHFEMCGCDNLRPLTRPPQSWCYVESEVAP